MSIRDLFVRLGVQVDGGEKVAAVDKQIRNLSQTVTTYANLAGFLLIAKRVKDFVEGTLDAANALKAQAETLGISTEELQNYQAVSKMMGVDLRQTAVAFRFFNRAIGEAAFGTKSAVKVMAQLGLNIRDANGQIKPTSELLAEVADKLHAMKSPAERTAIAMRLLGRGGAALLPVLSKGGAELRKLFRQLDDVGEGFDKAFVNNAQRVVMGGELMARGYRTLASVIGNVLLPYLLQWIDRSIKNIKVMIDYARHTNIVKTALMGLAAVIGGYIVALAILNPALLAMSVLWGVVAAAITAVYLAFDDLYTFLTGGISVIGNALEKNLGPGGAQKIRDGILTALQELREAFGLTGEKGESLLVTVAKLFADKLPGFVKFSVRAMTALAGAIDLVATGLRTLIALASGPSLIGLIKGEKYTGLSDAVKLNEEWQKRLKALQAVNDSVEDLDKKLTPEQQKQQSIELANDEIPQPFASGQQAPPAMVPWRESPAITNNTVQVDIVVQGNANPDDLKKAAQDGVKGGLVDAQGRNRNAFDAVTSGMPSAAPIGSPGMAP